MKKQCMASAHQQHKIPSSQVSVIIILPPYPMLWSSIIQKSWPMQQKHGHNYTPTSLQMYKCERRQGHLVKLLWTAVSRLKISCAIELACPLNPSTHLSRLNISNDS